MDVWKADIEKTINELNDKGLKIYNAAREKFADSPDVKAFCKFYKQLLNGNEQPADQVAAPATFNPELQL